MDTSLLFDAALLRRYDRPGPRYTSYPTAPHFGTHFTEAMLREYIRRGNAEPIPRQLSLYLHVPYCFSPCFYCGCNRVISRDLGKGHAYVERLVREVAIMGGLFDRDREVIQMHMGGGTPNFLGSEEMRELIESVRCNFHLSTREERDFSIELDPRWIEPEHIATYAELGFNRASLGVQDLDPDVQRAVNRVQSVDQTLSVIDACRARHFRSINIDLIYGLPKQTPEGFGRTLDTILAVRPERLAVYSYAHLPELFKAQRQIDAADLPSVEIKLGLLRLAVEKLSSAGYRYIGMDHFALPEDDLARAQTAGTLQRNFMGYTTHADCDLVGLGVSAISHIGDSFSQNARDIAGWERMIDRGQLPIWRGRHLDADDLVRGDVIQQLMCHGRVDVAAIEARHHIEFATYFSDALVGLQQLASEGLMTLNEREISATSRGRLLLRIIAMCFDRYLEQHSASVVTPRFSKVI